MNKTKSGFTIVELLIVIVVVGILAAITVVAYSGIQDRARNTIRSNDVATLQKALELYRIDNDRYPPHIGMGTNAPAGFDARYSSGYSYSVATDDSWLKNLRNSGVVTTVPLDPVNDNDNYYIYWSAGATGYGACKESFYVLIIVGVDANDFPDSRTLTCTNPDGSSSASWRDGSSQAVFSNTQTP